jgi:hypothetical protein
MSKIRIAATSLLVLCLSTWGYAQQQESQQQPDTVRQQEPKPQEPKHPPDAVPPEKPREAKPSQDQPQQEKPPKQASKPSKDDPQVGQEENGQHHQKGTVTKNGKSARIPEPQFKAGFGRQHSFTVKRVITQTTVVPSQTQFVYGGYTFEFVDPWPTAWLVTDDCYIDYVDDEYFLFDVLHPGLRVALIVIE